MKPNPFLLAVVFGSFLALFAVKPAAGDPPPWAGRWHHGRHCGDGHAHSHGGDFGRCDAIHRRIAFDRAKIHEIEPTGRHRKALRWYHEDLVNAERDLFNCRRGFDVRFDRDFFDRDFDDRYDDDSFRPFRFDRDWPEILSPLLYPR